MTVYLCSFGFVAALCLFVSIVDWLQYSDTQNYFIVRNYNGHIPYCTGYFLCMIALSIEKLYNYQKEMQKRTFGGFSGFRQCARIPTLVIF